MCASPSQPQSAVGLLGWSRLSRVCLWLLVSSRFEALCLFAVRKKSFFVRSVYAQKAMFPVHKGHFHPTF